MYRPQRLMPTGTLATVRTFNEGDESFRTLDKRARPATLRLLSFETGG